MTLHDPGRVPGGGGTTPGTIPAMADSLVRARALTKRFGDFVAVDGVDFDVHAGEAFGFLGPNGAGKSSTMRMIGAVSPISGGSLSVLGMDPERSRHRARRGVLGMDPERQGPAIRARLGVVPQENNLDTELPVEENLLIYGRYFGMSRASIRERIDELLDFAQLGDRRGDVVEHLSGGMKRRLIIARALINRPDVLILDEPTTGLGPQARHALWDRLYHLKQRGATLIVTTHYMDEAEQLCDRLVVMDNGKIVAEGSPRELIRAHSTREVIELRFAIGEQDGAAAKLDGLAKRMEILPDRILLYTDDADLVASGVHSRDLRPESIVERRSTLEDVFLRLTGRSLVD